MVESLYLHFPFCVKLCNYCDFYKNLYHNEEQDLKLYHIFLEKSFIKLKEFLEESEIKISPLKTIFIGGGTPSLWAEKGSSFLEKFMQEKKILLEDDYEFTVECNPESSGVESVNLWEKAGANRFSIGIQTFEDRLLKKLNRAHNSKQAKTLIEKIGKLSKNFSADLMLGLPFTQEHIKRDILEEAKIIVDSGAKHVSAYILTVKNNFIYKNSLPDDSYTADEYLRLSDFLTSKGYIHYEVSNFALPGFKSQHNLSYWRSQNMLALGPSAVGQLKMNNTTSKRYKWKNIKGEPHLEIEKLNKKELKIEEIYLKLRTSDGLKIEELFDTEERKSLLSIFKTWSREGFCVKAPINGHVKLLPKGYLMLDSLVQEIFSCTKF